MLRKHNFLLSALLVPAVILQAGGTCSGTGGPQSVTLPTSVTGIQTENRSATATWGTYYRFTVKTVTGSSSSISAGTTYGVYCTNSSGLVPGGGIDASGNALPPEDPNNSTGTATYTPVNTYSITSTITKDYGTAGLTYDATLNNNNGGFTTTSLTLQQEWAAVNWILNQVNSATLSEVPGPAVGTMGETPTTNDVRNAIYQLLHPDDQVGYVVYASPIAGSTLTGNSWLLYADALANGLNFVPTTGQVVGILMVPTTPAGSPQYQGFVIPVPIVCTSAQGSMTMTKTANVTSAAPFQLVTYTYTITNTGSTALANIAVTDDNGTPGYPGDDVIITAPAGTILQAGQSIKLTSTVYLPLSLFYQSGTRAAFDTLIPAVIAGSPNNSLSITYLLDTDVVDNTYGSNASGGWAGNGGHTFAQLAAGYAEFAFSNSRGQVVSDFTVGYLKNVGVSSSVPSGYAAAVISTSVPNSIKPVVDSTEADNLVLYPTATTNSLQSQGNWQTTAGYSVVLNEGAFGMYGFGSVAVKKNYLAATETGYSGKCGYQQSTTYTPTIVGSTVKSHAWATATVCGCTTVVKALACLSIQVSTCPSQPTCNNPGGHQCQNPTHCGCTCGNCSNGCHGLCTNWFAKCTPPPCHCPCNNCKAHNCGQCTEKGCSDDTCHENKCAHATIKCPIPGKPGKCQWLSW